MTQTISIGELNLQNKHPGSISTVRSDEFHHQNLESKEALPMVEALVQELQIVHATAGRIRIRTTDGSSIVLNSPSLKSLLSAISQVGVSEATWNKQTQSLVISFDPKLLSLAQMLAILGEFGIKGQSDEASESKPDVFAAWKSVEFWKEQGIDLIPLFTGLAVTSGLGISGLVSIPVYMVTANVARRAISHLQPLLAQASLNDASNVSVSTNNNRISLSSVQPSLSKLENSSRIEAPTSSGIVEKVNYSVVHAIPGRIRFHVPRIAKDAAYGKRLERLIKQEADVTSVRVNSDAASIAIAYQSSELTLAHWVSLIQLADEVVVPTIQNIDKKLAPSSTVITSQSQQERITSVTNTITNLPVTTDANSIVANFKPSFLKTLLSFAANYPLERICF
jgi:Heavy metal associated domain 2